MASRPVTAVPIAPSRPPASAAAPPRARAVAHSDIVFSNGLAYNGRGYRVCGVANQRGTLCGRIGTCPFHAGQTPGLGAAARTPKRRRSRPEADPGPDAKVPRAEGDGTTGGSLPECVRRLETPPAKMRFKRSWTPDEHRQFLASMKKFGKGKWKEIAREVATRTANQCQSHAQKYFLRQAKSDKERKKKSIHDLTDEPPTPAVGQPAVTVVPPVRAANALGAPAEAVLRNAGAHHHGFALGEDAADSHPGQPGVDALASAALAAENAEARMKHREAVDRALETAMQRASRAAKQEGDARALKAESEVATGGTDAGEAEATEDEDDAEDDVPETDATQPAPPAAPAANPLNVQAMALALAAAAMGGATAGKADQSAPAAGALAQLMTNPQAMLMLNPLLATLGAGAVSAPPVAAAAAAPPPAPARLRVTVHRNGSKGGGMALMLPDSMEEFFALAKTKLLFEGVFARVFTRSGGEITSLDQMVQDDALWLSKGEEFATPT